MRSRKGPGGGYILAPDPKGVTLLDVVEAVDGPVGEDGGAIDRRLQAVCDGALARERPASVTLAKLARGK